MNQTGHYEWINNKWQKVGDLIPAIERGVYFNKGGTPGFDKSANRTFQSKTEKRQWLRQNGLREGGIINPDKPPE